MNPEAARDAHETLVSTDLYANIIDTTGPYDAKVDSTANSSLAAHILNAVTIGVNAFVYEAVGPDEDLFEDYGEDVRVLASALALHDTDKFVREAYGVDVDGNSAEAFDWYFDPEPAENGEPRTGDPFGIEDFLGEGYRDDLQYLVQRTETTEDSRETRGIGTSFNGLERYCRIGDSTASVALRDGVDSVYDQLCTLMSANDVHRISFTQLEQPILNDTLLGVAKEVIAGDTGGETYGVIVGSSPSEIVYLGEPVDRADLEAAVAERAPERISHDYDFDCKLTWNSFEYDILEEVSIPVREKKEIIIKAFRDLLNGGPAGVEPFESIPESFDQYFPSLAKAIYIEGRSNFDDPDIQDAYDRIRDDKGPQKVKIHFIAYLVQHSEKHADFLEALVTDVHTELHADLKPETDAVGAVVERFFDGRISPDLGEKSQMCFLCGSEARNEYKKGHETIYQSQGFSRRLPPHGGPKSLCSVCNLEYSLLFDICNRKNINLNRSSPGSRTLGLGIAYYYFDDFLGDIRLRTDQIGMQVGENIDLSDPNVTTSLILPQYYIQPFKFGDHPSMSEKNHRMVITRQLMETAQESGMKVVVGRAFTRFEGADAVFKDEEATRPQELLGLDEAERFGPLPDFIEEDRSESHLRRALQLFKIMSMVGQDANMSNPYLHLDRDTFHSIAHFAVVNHDNATKLTDLREYVETYHNDGYQAMREIAEQGIKLFGTSQYDSKYKKTKIFRETLDAILVAKSQDMSDEHLVEYVQGQVYAAADREQYAPNLSPEEAKLFVKQVRAYLEEEELNDLKKLSDWEDSLVNTYYTSVEYALQDQ